ncbi:MAG: glycoside hydrolase family 2 [Planctomycetes bacterium]|nr:glycoside hydrolase family 2 [Planctomycetota bacterium]
MIKFLKKIKYSSIIIAVLLSNSVILAQEVQVKSRLMTRWAKEVTPENVHSEYPRPMMARGDWMNLNGLWDYVIAPRQADKPDKFSGKILAPFAIESALSGVQKTVGQNNQLWYRRTFEIPEGWAGKQILLNFGAVDWDCTVWVNNHEVGCHKGGYDPFTFNITSALKKTGRQEIVVSVWDPVNDGYQPRGKQVSNPHGIWYTSVTGIWQTVWLEPVAQVHIESIKITPDIDEAKITITVNTTGDASNVHLKAVMNAPGVSNTREVSSNSLLEMKISDQRLWSPDNPYLYDLEISLHRDNQVLDEVKSYFGMRKIEVKKDEGGINRLFLNNEAMFQFGPLDQGWWPDGLYTAPTDEALRYDIEVLKKLGCNMLRKHVKIEPERFYYWCDKLGLLVWQDMPSGDRYIGRNDPDIERTAQSAMQFDTELRSMIDTFYNHPCIVTWVPFNEGWGQFDTERIAAWIKEYDPSRLVINTSGWSDRGVGDIMDIHRYPGPGMAELEENRAVVLGEFGGLGLPLTGHTWQDEENWGYRSYETREELTAAYVQLLSNVYPLIGQGLAAAVYTQTTDVEIEVNGMMTYDRAIIKMDQEKARAANLKLYEPPPVIHPIVPTSRRSPQTWRYTIEEPASDWFQVNFNDRGWQTGSAPFGTDGTPGISKNTQWDATDIWLRRSFELTDQSFTAPHLYIYHDEDAEVYLNGKRIARVPGYSTSNVLIPLDSEAQQVLKTGLNTFAVHCRQTGGGQGIDVGIVDVGLNL